MFSTANIKAIAIFSSVLLLSVYSFFALVDNHTTYIDKILIKACSVLGMVMSGGALYQYLRTEIKKDSRRDRQIEPFIFVDEEAIVCDYPSNKKTEKVSWDKIAMIEVVTTDEGPAVCDVYILVKDTEGKGVVLPQEMPKTAEIVDRLLQLPGFDYETFAIAMGCSENKRFVVWKRE